MVDWTVLLAFWTPPPPPLFSARHVHRLLQPRVGSLTLRTSRSATSPAFSLSPPPPAPFAVPRNEKQSHERLTPLQVSAAAGHAEACVALLRALPSPRARAAVLAAASDGDEASSSGETALHLACLEGHPACVRAILAEVRSRADATPSCMSFCSV